MNGVQTCALPISKKSIQSLYNDIGQLETVSSEGVYDSYEQKVKWIYNNRLDGSGKVVELILDINLGSFYKHTISNMNDTYRYPLAFKGLLTNPYTFIEGQDLVQASGNDVTVNTEYRKSVG